MKVLGISGSPRKNGNTSFLVEEALRAARGNGIDTQLIHLCDYHITDCIGCEGCRESFTCVIKDDMQKLYPLLAEADAVVLGSPTYFYDVTALTKAFLDRCYCWEVFDANDRAVWMSVHEALGGKLAVVISVCEQQKPNDTGFAAQTMRLTLESLGYRVTDCVNAINLYQKDEASHDASAQEQARIAGRRLAATMKLKQKIAAKYQE
jgi:multimeric flavodoxin WrbA